MPQSIFVVHYNVKIGTNSVDGVTTIHSDPPTNAIEAGQSVVRNILTTAPQAQVEIIATKKISPEDYSNVIEIIKPTEKPENRLDPCIIHKVVDNKWLIVTNGCGTCKKVHIQFIRFNMTIYTQDVTMQPNEDITYDGSLWYQINIISSVNC